MNHRHKKYKGFTLIEMLISIGIFAVVSTCVYATFASGMNVWRRSREVNIPERQFLLKIEKFNRQIRQAFLLKDIPFFGTKDRVQFATVIDPGFGRLTYFFDAGQKAILRGYDLARDVIASAKEKEVLGPKFYPYLTNIDSCSLTYLYFDPKDNSYSWKEESQPDILPKAVKINIASDKYGQYSTTIFIAAS